jgi:hypothetical protein
LNIYYTTGEEVRLGDCVEIQVGGIPIKAKVVRVVDRLLEHSANVAPASPSVIRLAIEEDDVGRFQQVMWPGNSQGVAPFMDVDADEDLVLLSPVSMDSIGGA